jgi:Zn2+/Cd2+-exporting ATPase
MRDEALIGQTTARTNPPLRYRVAGMDCPSCVTKIETALRRLPGIADVSLNYHSQMLRLTLDEAATPRIPKCSA